MVEVSNALAQSFTANPTSPINIQESLASPERASMSAYVLANSRNHSRPLGRSLGYRKCHEALGGAGGGGYFLLHDPVRQYDDLIAKHNLTARKL